MKKWISRCIQNIPYYKYVEHWHLLPGVCRLLCWIGRHDYELGKIEDGAAILICMQCCKLKKSWPAFKD